MPAHPSGPGDRVREYVLTLLVTAAVTYLLTPLVRRVRDRGRARCTRPATGTCTSSRSRCWAAWPCTLGLAAGLLVAGQMTPLRTRVQPTDRDGDRPAAGRRPHRGDRHHRRPVGHEPDQQAGRPGGRRRRSWSERRSAQLAARCRAAARSRLTPNQSTAADHPGRGGHHQRGQLHRRAGRPGRRDRRHRGASSFFIYYYSLTQVLRPVDAGRARAGVRHAGRGLPGLPAAQLLPGPDLHGRHRRRCCSGCCWPTRRSRASPRSTRQPAGQRHREPVPRDPAAAAARGDPGDPVRGPAAGGGPPDPGGPVAVRRRTASTCTTGCSTSVTRTAPAC